MGNTRALMSLSEYNLTGLYTASKEKRAEVLRMYIACHGLTPAEADAIIAPLLGSISAMKFETKLNEVMYAITSRMLAMPPSV